MTASADPTLARIRFVLVETTHTGNLGAAARAMKTMGLARLELVRPRHPPDAEALARAAGADDLLARAGIHADLVDALAGCRLVIGSSARRRSLEWPLLEPPEAAQRLLAEAAAGEVALVFGRESSGLTNEELAHCHFLVHIPTNPGFSSLNLAAAVQVLAYEVRRTWRAAGQRATPGTTGRGAPGPGHRGGLGRTSTSHLAQTLVDIGFRAPEQSAKLLLRLRRLFNRARPDRVELNILRGILSAAQGRKIRGRVGRLRTRKPRL